MTETMEKNKCLKCETVTKDKKGTIFQCPNPDCGLNWEVKSGEWIIHGNLNLAWNAAPIYLPKKLTIRGDLNMMGCHVKEKSCENLMVDGNIYFCYTSNILYFPKKCEVGNKNEPRAFCEDSDLSGDPKKLNQKEIDEQKKFEDLIKKLPELESLV